jgi:thiol-disulfide isomerase/thioredoxin
LRSVSPTVRTCYLSRITFVLLTVLSFTGKIAVGQKILDIHDSASDLMANSRGKVLVLVFVRTDCPISNRYAPLIQELSRRYGRAVSFQLVFPDRNESSEQIKRFMNDYHYQLPALRDVNHVLARKTLVKVTPEAAVFDAQGVMVYHGRIDNLYEHIGQARRAATTHEVADAIDAAMKGVRVQTSAADGVGCFISDLE